MSSTCIAAASPSRSPAKAQTWDPESLVDLEDLESDWRSGDPPAYNGLVLTREQCQEWRLGSEWVEFDDDHRWLPYAGSKNVWD